jgi:hypothetical protein
MVGAGWGGDILLHTHTLYSKVPTATYHLPRVSRWLCWLCCEAATKQLNNTPGVGLVGSAAPLANLELQKLETGKKEPAVPE